MTRESAIGALLGSAAAGIVLLLEGMLNPVSKVESGPVLSETSGKLKTIVVHYTEGLEKFSCPIYRSLFAQLDQGVKINALVPDDAAEKELLRCLGPDSRMRILNVSHPLTGWARDRWLAFYPEAAKSPAVLLSPRAERLAESWPARAGDQQAAADLAEALSGLTAVRSDLLFDAGDFTADDQSVFVASSVVRRNVQVTVKDLPALRVKLQQLLKRKVTIFEGAPDHHVGMFLMVAGNNTVLVSDPKKGKEIIEGSKERIDLEALLPGGADFTPETQAMYDRAAEQAEAEGYRVLRIPSLHGADGRAYITYVNVLIDNPGGRPVVYLPSYEKLEALNHAASAVWRSVGYEVRPIDVTAVYKQGGTLHCLVNVISRQADNE